MGSLLLFPRTGYKFWRAYTEPSCSQSSSHTAHGWVVPCSLILLSASRAQGNSFYTPTPGSGAVWARCSDTHSHAHSGTLGWAASTVYPLGLGYKGALCSASQTHLWFLWSFPTATLPAKVEEAGRAQASFLRELPAYDFYFLSSSIRRGPTRPGLLSVKSFPSTY